MGPGEATGRCFRAETWCLKNEGGQLPGHPGAPVGWGCRGWGQAQPARINHIMSEGPPLVGGAVHAQTHTPMHVCTCPHAHTPHSPHRHTCTPPHMHTHTISHTHPCTYTNTPLTHPHIHHTRITHLIHTPTHICTHTPHSHTCRHMHTYVSCDHTASPWCVCVVCPSCKGYTRAPAAGRLPAQPGAAHYGSSGCVARGCCPGRPLLLGTSLVP